ncbi:MAG: hypothetical protein ACKO3N_18415, partial [Verrucomicrobiota bacterium]
AGNPNVNLTNPPPNFVASYWAEGRDGNNLLEVTALGLINPRVSLIARYLPAKGSFKCPGDKFVERINGRSQGNPRSYGLNAWVGWADSQPYGNGQGDNRLYVVVRRNSDARNPSGIFTFAEIHPQSVCRPFFGVNLTGNTGAYHVPGNYHGKVSNLAFVDGHVEGHKWVDGRFNDPKFAGDYHGAHQGGTPGTTSRPDHAWLRERTAFRR